MFLKVVDVPSTNWFLLTNSFSCSQSHSYLKTDLHTYTVFFFSPRFQFVALVQFNTAHMNLFKVLSALSRHTVVVNCWVSSRCAVMLCLASSVWDFQYDESFGIGCVALTAHTIRSVSLDLFFSLFTTSTPPPFCLAPSFLLPSNHCGNSFFFSFCQTKSWGPFGSDCFVL